MGREAIRILGVDTSLRATGVGVVESSGGGLRAVAWQVIRNPPTRPVSQCLEHLRKEILALIETTKPQVVAVEGIFFCRNVKTAVTLGEARGVVLAAAAASDLEVFEYPPRSVKMGVTGTGAAQKDQVAKMVMRILGVQEQPPEDAADALAIAICHSHRRIG